MSVSYACAGAGVLRCSDLGFLGDSSLPSALAAPASLRPHRPRPLDPGDGRSGGGALAWGGAWLELGGACLGRGRWAGPVGGAGQGKAGALSSVPGMALALDRPL